MRRGRSRCSRPRASSRRRRVYQRLRQPGARARGRARCCARPASTGEISLSHRVSGEYREYERTCTTVVDAYVRRRMGRYLDGSTARPRAACGFGGEAARHALRRRRDDVRRGARSGRSRRSCPARWPGVEGAAELVPRARARRRAITADVGGTSFDTCLITDGRPPVMYEGEVVGLPLQTPWVDVRSIGAGGGSHRLRRRRRPAARRPAQRGRRCRARLLRPRRHRADRDRRRARARDARRGELAGGVRLDARRAARARWRRSPGALGFDVEERRARGAARSPTARDGRRDPRDHRSSRARDPRERGARRLRRRRARCSARCWPTSSTSTAIVVPPYAGNFSAWGLLGAGPRADRRAHRSSRLDDEALSPSSTRVLAELFDELERAHGARQARSARCGLDLRYVGQEHTLTIAVPAGGPARRADVDGLAALFEREYERASGTTLDEELEIVTVRATPCRPAARAAGRRARRRRATGVARAARCAAVLVHPRRAGSTFAVVDRDDARPGDALDGPAIVIEPTATTYLDAGFASTRTPSGSLLIARRPDEHRPHPTRVHRRARHGPTPSPPRSSGRA